MFVFSCDNDDSIALKSHPHVCLGFFHPFVFLTCRGGQSTWQVEEGGGGSQW